MENNQLLNKEEEINRVIRRKTILSLSALALGFAIEMIGLKWMSTQPKDNEQPALLRKGLKFNERINNFFFNENNLAKEYPKSNAAKEVRVNGDIGIDDEDFDPSLWKLTINRQNNYQIDNAFQLKMEDIKALPKQSIIFNFKCIEGWNQVSHWGGTRFFDLMKKYNLGTHSGNAPDQKHPEDLYKYVGLVTPDKQYYVGIDMKSILHPQTLLCYEMNEEPLPLDHGYPLRLIIPVKYGIKNLKRIGFIFFSDTRPPDYWYEQGYDYDAAL